MVRKVLFFCFFWVTLSTHAQMGKLFDADKQMSSSLTSQIFLDRDGFIWVATRNGLNRYDGYQFRILKKETRQDLGMASNYVNCMMQDRTGLFYIGMYGALQTYDGERFHDVVTYDLSGKAGPSYVTSLIQRRDGTILVGTSGHGVLSMAPEKKHTRKKPVREARQIGGPLADVMTVHRMMEDRHGLLWLVTESQGLLCYDGKKVVRYFQGEDELGMVRGVCEDSEGRIYVATANAGMFRFSDRSESGGAMGGKSLVHIDGTGSKHISTLYVSHDNRILIGYDGLGLAIYDPKTGTVTDNPYYSRDVNLSTAKVYSICEDRNGNTWLGLLQKGIYMHPAKTTGFHYMGYKLGAGFFYAAYSMSNYSIYDSRRNIQVNGRRVNDFPNRKLCHNVSIGANISF